MLSMIWLTAFQNMTGYQSAEQCEGAYTNKSTAISCESERALYNPRRREGRKLRKIREISKRCLVTQRYMQFSGVNLDMRKAIVSKEKDRQAEQDDGVMMLMMLVVVMSMMMMTTIKERKRSRNEEKSK